MRWNPLEKQAHRRRVIMAFVLTRTTLPVKLEGQVVRRETRWLEFAQIEQWRLPSGKWENRYYIDRVKS